jgi:hypothetical protein
MANNCHFSFSSSFRSDLLRFDGRFVTENWALGSNNGVTFDGVALDDTTGLPIGPNGRHNFTAASKESLHLAMLALAISDATGPAAQLFFLNASLSAHLRTIAAKLDAFDAFNASFPGFGGWLPWVANDGVAPLALLNGWTDRVPALDNGEMVWGLIAVLQALRQLRSPPALAVRLAKRIDHRLAYLAYTAPIMFYDAPGSGYVRAVTKIANVSVFDPSQYSLDGVQVLDDPFEGELMVDFLCALTSLPSTECDAIWRIKQGLFVPVTWNNVTTQQGYWFSAHEQWKLLMLPYTSIDSVRAVFKLGEVARLRFSAQSGFPGLFASCTAPDGSYSSDQGVPPLAQLFTENTIVTPYGAWVSLLLFPNSSVPVQWLARMLSHPQMQSRTGVVESLGIAGAYRGRVMPLQTWDTKVTTDLAVCGGIGHLTGAYLNARGVAKQLMARIDNAYRVAFGANVQEPSDSDLVPPTAAVPIAPGTTPFQC